MDRRGLYLSPFDLNIEKEEIKTPLKPMVRFTTPVFNKRGQKKQDILVLSCLGNTILKRSRSKTKSVSGRTMMLDSEVYWILGPNPDIEWGFIYEDKKGLVLEKEEQILKIRIIHVVQLISYRTKPFLIFYMGFYFIPSLLKYYSDFFIASPSFSRVIYRPINFFNFTW